MNSPSFLRPTFEAAGPPPIPLDPWDATSHFPTASRPQCLTAARGSFGWFDRGRRVERSARSLRGHRRWGAMTRRGGGLSGCRGGACPLPRAAARAAPTSIMGLHRRSPRVPPGDARGCCSGRKESPLLLYGEEGARSTRARPSTSSGTGIPTRLASVGAKSTVRVGMSSIFGSRPGAMTMKGT